MRIAFLMNLAPRKLGSMEAWVIALCKEAVWRGHQVDIYGRAPVHPVFTRDLEALGVGWGRVDELERDLPGAIRTLSRYDILHLNLIAPRSRAALAAYGAYPANVLYVAHSERLPSPPGENRAVRLVRTTLDRLTRLRIDALAGVSDCVREKERLRFGLSPSQCCTIYNGIDLERFRPRPEPRKGGPIRLLTVAYFMRHKGVHHLINALSRIKHPNVRLTIAGDGPEIANLQEQARALQLPARVDFAGLRDDVPALMQQADVFLHSSHVEAFGLTIAEAMATQLPVIASRVGGVPEVIEDGKSGLLVSAGDEAGIAAALERLLAQPELRLKLGEEARSRVRQRFTLRASVVQHIDWCEAVHAERSGVRAIAARLRGVSQPVATDARVPVHPTPSWSSIPDPLVLPDLPAPEPLPEEGSAQPPVPGEPGVGTPLGGPARRP